MVALVIFSIAISPAPRILWSLFIGCSFDWIPRTDIPWPALVESASLLGSSWVGSRQTSSVGLTVLYLGRLQIAGVFVTMHCTGIPERARVIPANTHVTWEPVQVSAQHEWRQGYPPVGAEAVGGSRDIFLSEVFNPPFMLKGVTHRKSKWVFKQVSINYW